MFTKMFKTMKIKICKRVNKICFCVIKQKTVYFFFLIWKKMTSKYCPGSKEMLQRKAGEKLSKYFWRRKKEKMWACSKLIQEALYRKWT